MDKETDDNLESLLELLVGLLVRFELVLVRLLERLGLLLELLFHPFELFLEGLDRRGFGDETVVVFTAGLACLLLLGAGAIRGGGRNDDGEH